MPSSPSFSADTPPELEPATRVLRQFRIVFNAVKSHFRQVEKTAGIGGAQLWALSVIDQRPAIGVGELSRELDVHQTTASNLVKSLATQGLIELGRHAQDRRAVTMRLSPDGQDLLKRAPMPFAGVLPDVLGAMDADVLARLERDLGEVIHALEAGTAGADVPLAEL